MQGKKLLFTVLAVGTLTAGVYLSCACEAKPTLTARSGLSGKFSDDATCATLFYGGTAEAVAEKYDRALQSARAEYTQNRTEAEQAADFAERYPNGYPEFSYFTPYLCSTAYPFRTVQGRGIMYSYSQQLSLKRDYTYSYVYTITLTQNEDEWGKDCAQISVALNGTFTYEEGEDEVCFVQLSDPTAGSVSITAPTVIGETYISNWTPAVSESYKMDIAYELSCNAEFQYDRYTMGRTVLVDKEEKSLTDDVYFTDIVDDVAPYSDYTCIQQSGGTE